MANVVIVEDHKMISGLYIDLINEYTNHSILNRFSNGEDAFKFIVNHNVDLVITDLMMPHGDGIYMTKALREFNKDIKILVITQVSELGVIDYLLNGFVDGIINKNSDDSSILEAIDSVLNHQQYICSYTNEILKNKSKYLEPDLNVLTRAEIEVLQMIVNGMSTKDIADKRFTSPQTVQTQRKSLMKKLSVKSVQELINVAVLKGYATLQKI